MDVDCHARVVVESGCGIGSLVLQNYVCNLVVVD